MDRRKFLAGAGPALALPADVPIISLDARDREQAKGALVKITEYALMRLRESLTVNAN